MENVCPVLSPVSNYILLQVAQAWTISSRTLNNETQMPPKLMTMCGRQHDFEWSMTITHIDIAPHGSKIAVCVVVYLPCHPTELPYIIGHRNTVQVTRKCKNCGFKTLGSCVWKTRKKQTTVFQSKSALNSRKVDYRIEMIY